MVEKMFPACSRRAFVASVAASAGLRAAKQTPRLCVACYIWLQDLARRGKTLDEGLDAAFDDVVASGFKRIELSAQFFTPELTERTKRLLREKQVAVPAVYSGGVAHIPEEAAKTIENILGLADRVKAAGATGIDYNPDPKPRRAPKSDEELDLQVQTVNRLGAELGKRGMHLEIHQHDAEMADNAREWRRMLQETDPATVSFCLDLHWVFRGGQDPLALLNEAGQRVASLHVRNSKAGVWLEDFGDGDIDYRKIGSRLLSTGFSGYVTVELAYEKGTTVTRSLVENLRRSRLYAAEVFGAR